MLWISLPKVRLLKNEAIQRIDPNKLDELLHPVFDPIAEKKAVEIARGLPASPGVCLGRICFFADEAAHL